MKKLNDEPLSVQSFFHCKHLFIYLHYHWSLLCYIACSVILHLLHKSFIYINRFRHLAVLSQLVLEWAFVSMENYPQVKIPERIIRLLLEQSLTMAELKSRGRTNVEQKNWAVCALSSRKKVVFPVITLNAKESQNDKLPGGQHFGSSTLVIVIL